MHGLSFLAVGVVVGSVVTYVYAAHVLSVFKSAAAEAGVLFQKVEGKWQAVRKAL